MSELHTYRIHVTTGTGGTTTTDESAFTADDALTQFRAGVRGDYSVFKIEPLPDAPARGPEIGELVAALEWCGGSADFGEGGRACDGWARVVQPLLDRFHGKPKAPPAGAPDAYSLGPQVYPPDPEHPPQYRAGPIAPVKTNADERDRLRAELARLRSEYERAIAFRAERFDEIAALVWPGTPPGACEYKLKDLVEAVRKMGAQRNRALEDRNDLAEKLRILTEERDSLSRNLDRDRADLAKMRDMWKAAVAERDGLQKQRDATKKACLACADGRVQAVTDLQRERDALQKRIDAAKAWLAECTWAAPPTGLIAILEGREP